MVAQPRTQPPVLRARRLRETARLPRRATPHSSGLDVFADFGAADGEAMLDATPRLIPTGVAIETPPGYEVQVRPRSGLSRRGVVVAFGTVDADYRGELFVNMSWPMDEEFTIRQGDRIAQLVVAPVALSEVEEVEELGETERGGGGFGSTGR